VNSLGSAILGIFGVTPEETVKLDKEMNDWLSKAWSKMKEAVNNLVGNFLGWFAGNQDPSKSVIPKPVVAPEVQAENKRKVALANVDMNKSGALDTYNELKVAILRSKDLDKEMKVAMMKRANESQKAGTNFAQFVQGDTTVNQLVASFGPQPGSSSSLTVHPIYGAG
jgi:hypothetical protein